MTELITKDDELEAKKETNPLRRAGRLAFFCFVDTAKLASILRDGIKPLGITRRPLANQFPDRVSLAALGRGGYLGMLSPHPSDAGSIHWLVRFTTSRGISGVRIPDDLGYSVVLLLDDGWVKDNIGNFKGVGPMFSTDRRESTCVGSLEELPIDEEVVKTGKVGDLSVLFPEVWYADSKVVPPESILDVVIADPNGQRYSEILQELSRIISTDHLQFWDQESQSLRP